jgi:hypothetical protein
MKVVCIDNIKYPELEVGKPYNAELIFQIEGQGAAEWTKNMLNIEGQSELNWYETNYFIPIDEWREQQLNKIL